LKTKQGSDFDKAYARQEVKDHEEAVKLFKDASRSKDPDIAAFAQKILPTLEHHLAMAKSMKKALS
jgi:putative membrane protein